MNWKNFKIRKKVYYMVIEINPLINMTDGFLHARQPILRDYAPSGRQHVWPMDKMSQNKQVFRHMTDIFVFRNYLGPSISNTFKTSWTHFRHLPDGLKNFQTPSKHLPDIFQTPLRAPQETLKFTDIWPIKWQRLKSSVHYELRNCKMKSVKSFPGHPVVA